MVKMYFIDCADSKLEKIYNELPSEENTDYTIYARGFGMTNNMEEYYDTRNHLVDKPMNLIILTNDDSMLEYVDLFNGGRENIDLFVWDGDRQDWFDCRTMYRNVRKCQNLRKMLLNGIFTFDDNEINKEVLDKLISKVEW